jgi:hypothetical protein
MVETDFLAIMVIAGAAFTRARRAAEEVGVRRETEEVVARATCVFCMGCRARGRISFSLTFTHGMNSFATGRFCEKHASWKTRAMGKATYATEGHGSRREGGGASHAGETENNGAHVVNGMTGLRNRDPYMKTRRVCRELGG